ncbi:TRAM domain-containing protein [Natronomonas sp. F2-12]|uniref:TRAM domain-containing protein n=1 Tax=Natronomonas aquatica TaxID=2841590 RepID=A0A9R1CSM3_9EURY|nr:TRAM domain-containing protein [Natronomonas aquatica]MCQ4333257.1 TRAM domain-containing protein [Natronomonas aquatica]
MEISEQLHCLFSATVEQRDGSYLIELPDREIELGALEASETYRVALLPTTEGATPTTDAQPESDADTSDSDRPEPPVTEGENRTVEIEDIGSQGDGITRVERGYVIIVPDTERGERVRIEVTDVQENVAFAEVTERLSYYE